MIKLKRRAFLAGTSAVLILPALPALAADYKEAAILKDKVSGGALPPLKDRLPENPLVIKPVDSIGKYGGDWNMALVGGGSLSMLFRYQAYEPLLRYTPDWSGVTLNVAEAFDGNADSTEYTIRLRKGMKWSDGQPYTTADVKFWYDTILTDKRVAVNGQGHWKTSGKPAKLEIIDEQTFKVMFAKPNGMFPLQVAWANSDHTTRCPKHYLEQFHIDYNPKADELAKQRGFESWIAAFQSASGFQDDNAFFLNSSKKPCLHAWMFTVAPGENTERAIAERNPFYWKVDTEGNQLPYMDRIVYQMVADPQVLLLKAMQGEIDLMDQYIATPNNKSVLYDAREQGKYDFYTLTSTEANVMNFIFNLNHNDETKRKLFRNKDFRAALSLALDRQSLIDAVLVGQGAPAQPSIKPGDPLYNEQLATQFTSYDVDKANAMLDQLVPKRDDQNFRLDEKGRRLTVIFEIDQARAVFLDLFQLVIPMFQAVGIDAQMRTMDRSLWETRVRQGRDFDATAHQFGANGGVAAMLDPRYYVPTDSNAMYAPAWQLWYLDRNNANAEEPPEETKKQLELYDKLKSTSDPAAQQEVMKQILQGAADNFYVFGISLPPDGYGIVKNNMKNITKTMPNSFGWPTPAPTMPEQFYKV
ncbi:ABC transporter substrate-binding protein [Rhizobium hidalgonense]|uniref:ABC transporter substrate-binding protein n=1 Tax=Rhizobium hidalgonense TaxID=1538159 RepID=A0A2A6K9E6_9HYPH|nr:ABC transporter substrate-binding protein [Rhizobium hidalgonense]MDR9776914.1 ABC transporter substrate-binding protein [Rhizobium hidalgonense]MDR9813957.1 ABC transporter substrate-binding protein [Rhizobium hidalgonense]MDR9820725.1 ABC transporter substrate-binding protein [Rhizobium hidalgonense]PDT21414.1 ABC transporter substrate-binding protein [Rhizobium hidalgonense]PON08072.1 ABC transporter substrate-binding protein [Rhizobium hidalgonense]